MTTFVGSVEVTVYCPDSFSLKDKRRTLNSLLDRVREDLNVAAAEVDHQDHHRLATLAFATVNSNRHLVERVCHAVENEVVDDPVLTVREIDRHVF